jgi:hypothetical protein
MYYILELFDNQLEKNCLSTKTYQDLLDYNSVADKIIVFSNNLCPKLFDIFIQTKDNKDALVYAKILEYGTKKNNKSNDTIINLFIKIHYDKFLQITKKINNINA